MKRVLIITYYWPPSGGSGVQRWLKFVKYLPAAGVIPYVYTPENPSFDLRDESLLKDVPSEAQIVKFPIWEPYEIFFKLSALFGQKKSNKPTDVVSLKTPSKFQQLTTWIRGNLFVPDPRKFWVKPSVKFLEKFLQDNDIQTIITTGPPHSMHLIGYRLKKNNPSLKWFADFRDPWSEWGFLESIKVGERARRKHQLLEAQVLKTADRIISITPFYVRHFERLSGRPVQLLTNGFDEDDFKNLEIKTTQRFVIRHVGIINERCDPRPVMNAIRQLMLDNASFAKDLQIDFVGDVHPAFREFVMADSLLSSATAFTSTLPHKKLIPLYGESSLMLLVLTGYKDAEGYMPGKLFEYLATGLPILGVGPENGDAAQLLNQSKQGMMIDGTHQDQIIRYVLQCFTDWKRGEIRHNAATTSLYSRREITKSLAAMI